jgi:hypothetical protein
MLLLIIFVIVICIWVLNLKKRAQTQEQTQEQTEEKFNNMGPKQTRTKKHKKKKINQYIQDVQYNPDYRNVLNVIKTMCPAMGTRDRLHGPIHMEQANNEIVKKLTKKFINDLNKNIDKMSDFVDIEGGAWNDDQPEYKIKSGWEKQQEALGLPTSLYNDHLGKKNIKLLQIEKTECYKTDTDCKYEIYVIIHKEDAADQMCLKLVYVSNDNMAKLALEKDFFSSNKIKNNDEKLYLDGIYVVGFRSDGFVQPDDGVQLGDQKDIIRNLISKKKKYKKNL